MNNIDWKNVWTNIGAIFVFAEAMYPGLDANMIMTSIQSGTFLQGVFNLILAYLLVSIKGSKQKVDVVLTEEDEIK